MTAPLAVVLLDMEPGAAHTVAVDTGMIDRPLDTAPAAAGIPARMVDTADRVAGMLLRGAAVVGESLRLYVDCPHSTTRP